MQNDPSIVSVQVDPGRIGEHSDALPSVKHSGAVSSPREIHTG
jgi:hypothetical protein